MRRRSLAVVSFLVLGCRAAASPGSPPAAGANAALTGAACPSAVGTTLAEEWREVHTAAFTFCVPPGWAPRDVGTGRTWRGDGVEVRWSTGVARETTTDRERIELRPGETPDAAAQRLVEESRMELRETDEVIGGRRARLTYNHVRGTYYASARWEDPVLQFTGTAPSPRGAARAMQVYRTVRFAAPDSAEGTGRR